MNRKTMYAAGMTVLWSVVFMNAFHDRTLGICMGITIGVAFGLFDKDDSEEGT